MGARRFLAAAVQLCAGSDKAVNLDKAEALVREAARQGAALVALPEVFNWRGAQAEEIASAEPIPGPTTARLGRLAQALRIHLLGGSVLERAGSGGKAFNTSCLFNPRGELIASYRKAHLFDIDLAGHVTMRESDTRQGGGELASAVTELGCIGLSICYDLRFPELYRQLTRSGAQIIMVPSAFTFPTGAAHWEILLRARAIENQVYVVAPDQIGHSPSGVNNFGNSLIVDPWGKPLARAADRELVIVAEIDLDYLDRVRRELPCLDHVKFVV
ncbi:MAG: carbon-nitrogen hydrolase family protein [Deltaproteobacteria bacterium]|nr:carbon-nitrogen hydrolase family protein [Deltaproteobacteria bacterium]